MPVRRPLHRRAARAARWFAVVPLVLAGVVAFLVPPSRVAGTETSTQRWTTVAALVLAGVLLRLAPARALAAAGALAALLAGAVVVPSHWLAALGVLLVLTLAGAWMAARVMPSRSPAARGPEGGHGGGGAELLESIATALLLALVVREFAFEAFKIPTGSMEPTIYGDQHGRRKGDRLLANKWETLLHDPPRWSIVVFRFPLFRPTNYIKRLVGLPGEHLELREGDVYVNGRVVAKPDVVQESLWFPEWPAERPGETRRGDSAERLAEAFDSEGAGRWKVGEAAASVDVPPGQEGRLSYRRDAASDLRLSFDLRVDRLSSGGSVAIELEGGGRRVTLAAGGEGLWLSAPGVERQRIEGRRLRDGDRLHLALGVADRVARVWVDGRQVARVPHADERNTPSRREGAAAVLVSGAKVEVSGVRLEHDLQYATGTTTVWDIPEDGFVMLGDNTYSSRDSREWRAEVFVMKDGSPDVVVPSTIRLDDETEVGNSPRETADGAAWQFVDSYGAKRTVRKADVKARRSSVAQPFVLRSDLVGRAFLIFFPFPPLGEFRPRILP